MNLALLSPQKEAYSETFIKVQKELLPYRNFYYYDGFLPKMLEGHGLIQGSGDLNKIRYKIRKYVKLTLLDYSEFELAKSLKKNKINVVLAQFGLTGVAVLSVCKLLNLPLIVYFHGYDASKYEFLKKFQKEYVQVFNYAKSIIAVSEAMRNKLIEIGCTSNKIKVIPSAPEDKFFDIEPNFENPHFIGLGRFTDKKAPYYTILAFNEVLKKFPNAKLTIGGNGELYNVCINLVKYIGIEHAVGLPGIITPGDFRK